MATPLAVGRHGVGARIALDATTPDRMAAPMWNVPDDAACRDRAGRLDRGIAAETIACAADLTR